METNWLNSEKYNELEDDLVQVLCVCTPIAISGFPRSCDFPISSGDHGAEEHFVSIGFYSKELGWQIAGWDMNQDCWTNAQHFRVIGYQPLAKI